MDTKALQKIQYGLFVLSSRQDDKDNACIVNTVLQVTSSQAESHSRYDSGYK